MNKRARIRVVLSACVAAICAIIALSPQSGRKVLNGQSVSSDTQNVADVNSSEASDIAKREAQNIHEHSSSADSLKEHTDVSVHSPEKDVGASQTIDEDPSAVSKTYESFFGKDQSITTYREQKTLVQVASELLKSYQSQDNCALLQSGSLDLFGRVWGCMVSGQDWIEMVFIQSEDEGTSCEVRVVRLQT